jgi:putative chitinase
MLTLAMLEQAWPLGNSVIPGLREGVVASAPAVFAKYKIPNDRVIAHIMGEFSEESGCGTEMRENMNYSASRLLQVFPTHFTTAQAIAMQHNARLIADRAYGSRMGNRPGTDDGYNLRGQGFSQLTGLENYLALSKTTGFDLVNHPAILCDPKTAFECAVGDFVQCGCLPYAVRDDLVGVASMLNMGRYCSNVARINGYSIRAQEVAIWKHLLGVA